MPTEAAPAGVRSALHEAILVALRRGEQTSSQIADSVDVDRRTAIGALMELRAIGKVTRTIDRTGDPIARWKAL